MEPPNKGQFGSRAFALFSEVVQVGGSFKLLFIRAKSKTYIDSMMYCVMGPNSS